MNATQIFKLPDLGEGLTESEVLSWKIQVGQQVELNQVIAEVETAKAIVELPSPFSGVVQQLHAEPGEVVPVGSPLVTFGEEQEPGTDSGQPKRNPTLVGYGAPPATGKRPARRNRSTADSSDTKKNASGQSAPPPVRESHDVSGSTSSITRREVPRSTPPVRKYAREHGVDLALLQGSGRDGLIVRADVEAAISANTSGQDALSVSTEVAASADEDRIVKISAVRRATAKAMVESAFTAPHAAEFLTVDVTASLDLVKELREHPLLSNVHVNFTTLAAMAVTRLLSTHRSLNSTWDGENDRIIEHGSVNLGMAVATERGLLVPVVHRAHRLGMEQMAHELSQVIELGRAGTLKPAQLSGGTFSITNVGVFGIDAGTPILPPGQSAILAIGQIKRRPWEYRDEVALRHTATLALSFDHRLIDGKEGSEFLRDLGAILENPGLINLFI